LPEQSISQGPDVLSIKILSARGKYMSDRLNIVAEDRMVIRKEAKRLRRDGWIPAVIYGQEATKSIKIENLPLRRVLRDAGATNLIEIDLGEDHHIVLAREVQVHPTRGSLIHVDFYEVNMLEKIVVEAALITTGIAQPEADGLGSGSLVLYAIEIECLPDNLISEIIVDMSQIVSADDTILVRDLPLAEGVTFLADPESVVARFDYIQAEEEEVVDEDLIFAPSEDKVEVIGRGKEDDEESELAD
jgi:large subunit ribosomal protein L25